MYKKFLNDLLEPLNNQDSDAYIVPGFGETDLVDIESKNGGGIDRAFVLRKMKNEGCDRPGFVEAGEWGRV